MRPVGCRVSEAFSSRLAAAKIGEDWAIAEIWRDTHPRLFRYLRASLADGSAEDIASDVWLDVAQGLAGFDGGESEFQAFVFTIARRRVIDHTRRAARRRTTPVASDARVFQVAGHDEASPRLALDSALSLIAELPRAQAEVILLRVLGDLSVEETARVVNRRPGAVRVLQHRALGRLRSKLNPAGRNADCHSRDLQDDAPLRTQLES
jgi:RNA polymerase sigma-70 factor (ECF subfamily)